MKIDFRSDTVTRPDEGMLGHMMSAKVGDDVFGEDPTVNFLEEQVALLFRKETALFCSSGTMTNQIAVNVHTQPGDAVICSELAHVYLYEGGGMAANSGVTSCLLKGDRGRFTASDVEQAIHANDIHKARTSLVCVEDTTNKGGGAVWDVEELRKIKKVCEKHGLQLHLDGARLFNALLVNGLNSVQYGDLFDTISVCLSKGLGAPVGSLLVGSQAFIDKARRVRKRMGGGMRQAGYLASAGVYAIDYNASRMVEDHQRTKEAAELIAQLSEVEKVLEPQTNILIFYLKKECDPQAFLSHWEKKDVRMIGMGGQAIRIVYHLDIEDYMHEQFMKMLKAHIG